jgi:hypothetical protein
VRRTTAVELARVHGALARYRTLAERANRSARSELYGVAIEGSRQVKQLYDVLTLLPGEDDGAAELLTAVARLQHEETDLARAAPVYERALALRAALHGPRDPRAARAALDLAELWLDRGEVASVGRLLESAAEAPPPPGSGSATLAARLARAQGRLSLAHGHADRALPLLQRALALRRAQAGPRGAAVAAALLDLAQLEVARQRLDDAQRLLEQAARELGAPRVGTAAVAARLWRSQGALLRRRARYAAADRVLGPALERCEGLLGPHHPATASTRTELGLLRLDQGAVSEAEVLLKEAADSRWIR